MAFIKDRNIGNRTLPKFKELLVLRTGYRFVAPERISARQAKAS
jgi:hypothetical protein